MSVDQNRFANVRDRIRKPKGCLDRKIALVTVFTPVLSVKTTRRKISGPDSMPEIIQGEFEDGLGTLRAAV